MSNFKVGDKVLLDTTLKSSEVMWLGGSENPNSSNPFNMMGTVTSSSSAEWGINVTWENGKTNCYMAEHLLPTENVPKDIFGTMICVGDDIAYNPPYYKGLVTGTVLSIGENTVTVKSHEPTNNLIDDTCTRPQLAVVVKP